MPEINLENYLHNDIDNLRLHVGLMQYKKKQHELVHCCGKKCISELICNVRSHCRKIKYLKHTDVQFKQIQAIVLI